MRAGALPQGIGDLRFGGSVFRHDMGPCVVIQSYGGGLRFPSLGACRYSEYIFSPYELNMVPCGNVQSLLSVICSAARRGEAFAAQLLSPCFMESLSPLRFPVSAPGGEPFAPLRGESVATGWAPPRPCVSLFSLSRLPEKPDFAQCLGHSKLRFEGLLSEFLCWAPVDRGSV